jgi:hypothetical protein
MEYFMAKLEKAGPNLGRVFNTGCERPTKNIVTSISSKQPLNKPRTGRRFAARFVIIFAKDRLRLRPAKRPIKVAVLLFSNPINIIITHAD